MKGDLLLIYFLKFLCNLLVRVVLVLKLKLMHLFLILEVEFFIKVGIVIQNKGKCSRILDWSFLPVVLGFRLRLAEFLDVLEALVIDTEVWGSLYSLYFTSQTVFILLHGVLLLEDVFKEIAD